MKKSRQFEARLKPLKALLGRLSQFLPELNFITFHYFYFLFLTLTTAIIFWGSSTPERSVRFIDAVFFTVAAMTEAGLNTVNLSELSTWQQVDSSIEYRISRFSG